MGTGGDFMNNFFRQSNSNLRIFALIYIVFGFILCFFNKNILINAARIIGIVLFAYGVYQLFIYFSQRIAATTVSLFSGIPCTLIGAFMFFSPQSIVAVLPVLAGFILIVNSVMQMQKSFILKDHHYDNWIWNFGISLITLIGGLIILLRPIQTLAFILQLVGICLIIEGVIMLFNEHEINKYVS